MLPFVFDLFETFISAPSFLAFINVDMAESVKVEYAFFVAFTFTRLPFLVHLEGAVVSLVKIIVFITLAVLSLLFFGRFLF